MANSNKNTKKRILWFPGETSWEQWFVVPGKKADLIGSASEQERSFVLNDRGERVLAAPVNSVVSLPLHSNAADEAGLIGTARMHAERSGAGGDEQGIGYEILAGGLPNTVIRVEAPLPSVNWGGIVLPDRVCSSASFLPWSGDSVAVWRELGQLVVGFSKNGKLVFFDRLSSSNPGADTGAEIQRLLFQLNCQGIEIRPSELQLWTEGGDIAGFQSGSGLIVKQSPSRPEPSIDPVCELTPLWLRESREKSGQRKVLRKRLGVFAAAAMVVVGAFAAMSAVEFLKQKQLRSQLTELSPVAGRIENMKAQWEEVAAAVDREATHLETLRMIQEMDGASGVQLSKVEITNGTVAIAGESSSPRAALQFLDAVSLSEQMAEYGWKYDPPEIRANGSAAFEIEGTR